MSRLDELLERLAPDGVPFVPLATVARRRTGIPITAGQMRALHRPGAPVRVYAAGETAVDADCTSVPAGCIIEPPGIVVKSRGNIGFEFAQRPFTHKSELWSYTASSDSIDLRFLYYYLQSRALHLQGIARATSVKLPQLSVKDTDAMRVPLPPREVQAGIVHVLDSFQALEAELRAESEARCAQYAHYRRAILAPGPAWRTTTVDAVAQVFDGPHATPRKTAAGPWYLSISSLQDGHLNLDASSHLSTEDYVTWTSRVSPSPGDTLFSYETRIGQAAYWDSADPAALGRRMGILRPRIGAIDPRFLTIAYLSPEFQEHIRRHTVQGSTVDRISIGKLPRWPISLPDLPEQRRIVDLLDSFDALVNDLSSGLPAELAARRQQFEHYRDRLLTFKEA